MLFTRLPLDIDTADTANVKNAVGSRADYAIEVIQNTIRKSKRNTSRRIQRLGAIL
jgi:hypothetical protein